MGLKEAIWGLRKRVVVKRELKRIARLRKASVVRTAKMTARYTKKRGKAAAVLAYDGHSPAKKYQRRLADTVGLSLLNRIEAEIDRDAYRPRVTPNVLYAGEATGSTDPTTG